MISITQCLHRVLVNLVARDNPQNETDAISLFQYCAVNQTENLRCQQRLSAARWNFQTKGWQIFAELVSAFDVPASRNADILPCIQCGMFVACRLLLRQFQEISLYLIKNAPLVFLKFHSLLQIEWHEHRAHVAELRQIFPVQPDFLAINHLARILVFQTFRESDVQRAIFFPVR